MLNFVPEKVFLRGVLFHYFNMKKTAAESHRILVEVYGEHCNKPFDIGTPYEIMSFFRNKFISTTHDVHDKLHIITVSTTKFSNKIMAL